MVIQNNKKHYSRFYSIFCAIAFIAIGLSGCGTVEDAFKRWQGKGPAPPLPGKRLSVLTNDRTLTADKTIATAKVILPAPTYNKSWPQAGGYPNHAMHHIKVRDYLQKLWSVDIGEGTSDEERLNASPVVAGQMIFAIDSQSQVSAYNTKNGRRVWKIDLTPKVDDDGHIVGGIAYENDVIYVTTGFAEVVALRSKTGKILWRKILAAPMRSAPTVREGRLFVITMNNELYALNAQNGEVIWQHRGLPEIASVLGGASPAVDKDVVIAPYTSGELIALKVENGRVLWQDTLTAGRRTDAISNLAGIRGHPVIDRGLVIAVSNGGIIAAIEIRTGRRIWSREIASIETPWVAGNYVFVLSNESELVAISRESGKIKWVRGLPRFENPDDREDPIVWTGPLLTSDRLIIAGSNEDALAVSPYNGKILGVIKMPDRVNVAPIVADGKVYFLADNAQLVAYR
ncbi:MAG: pyrrolo-quinoline quinone [Magnetovibrio sp.]|nr:pyrrolo-quinoline quinone [Magnetovibrio sp.]